MTLNEREVAIEVQDLHKSYGDKPAIDGLSFIVPKGVVFCLIGPNGAGKTTTISIMEGLLKRNSGDVRILGLDPWKDIDSLKSRIGVLPQEFNFFDKLTPLDSIKFYRSLFNSEIDPESLLELISLKESSNVPYEELSGGQRQKVGLALAIINNPEILFLDEPTTGLDPVSRRSIWSIIKEFKNKGKTVILTTHYMEEAERLSDIVAIIRKGRLVAMGKPEELIATREDKKTLKLKAGTEMADYLRSCGVKVLDMGESFQIMMDPDIGLAKVAELIESSGLRYSHLSVNAESLEDLYIRLVNEKGVET